MIIIGEKLNSTIPEIRIAVENGDRESIANLAIRQYQAGATFIDINAGMFAEEEADKLAWMATVLQDGADVQLCIDSPNPKAIRRALEVNRNPNVMVNSINGEQKRFSQILPLVREYDTSVIALCMGDSGIPETVEARLRIGEKLVEDLTKEGVAMDKIFLDPLVLPVSTGSQNGNIAIDTIRALRRSFPTLHIVCGLSNISFHLPARKRINQAFLVAAMSAGLDGAIMDPLDGQLMSMLYAGEALFGTDNNCKNYLKKFREGEV